MPAHPRSPAFLVAAALLVGCTRAAGPGDADLG
jgi:hypothetical protein